MTNHHFERYFFIALLLIITTLGFYILRPFLGVLSLSATLAIVFYPVFRILHQAIRSPFIAALFTTILAIVIIFAPVSLIGAQIFLEAQKVYSEISLGPDQLSSISEESSNIIHRFFPDLTLNLRPLSQQVAQWMVRQIGVIFSSTIQAILTFILSLLGLFYLLKDGAHLRRWLLFISPLPNPYDQRILDHLHLAVASVVRGSLGIAFLQGIVTTLGLVIFGVPHAVLWGSLAVVAALVPNVGTALVTVPSMIFLFLTNHALAAVGLLIWSLLAVGLLDNLLGPFLMKKGLRLHPFVVLLSVMGGLAVFGPEGFLIGPLVISFLFALLDLRTEILKA